MDTDFAKFPYELAKGKNVLVIGGGDTAMTVWEHPSVQGEIRNTALEMMPQPPAKKNSFQSMAGGLKVLKTDYGQEEAILQYSAMILGSYQTTVTEFIMTKKENVCKAKIVKLKR